MLGAYLPMYLTVFFLRLHIFTLGFLFVVLASVIGRHHKLQTFFLGVKSPPPSLFHNITAG